MPDPVCVHSASNQLAEKAFQTSLLRLVLFPLGISKSNLDDLTNRILESEVTLVF